MIKRPIALLFLLPLTILVFSDTDWACSCGVASPCQAYRVDAAIFVGTPVSVRSDTEYSQGYPVKGDGTLGPPQVRTIPLRIFTFESTEVFKGRVRERVEITTQEGSCSYEFEIGKKYIVFASRTKSGDLVTSICHRTRPIEEAGDDLEILHNLKSGVAETRIFGLVRRNRLRLDGEYGSTEYIGGIAGAVITAKSKTSSFETTTDAQGRFRFIDLPIGTYTIDATVPNGKIHGGRNTIEVTRETCGGEIQFYGSIDANITGHIFDFEGKPAYAVVSLVSIEMRDGHPVLKEKQISYPKDGIYEFEGAPPGQYVIGVSILDKPTTVTPYSKMFYPQTSDLDKATIIDVKEGQQLTFDLSLFPPLPLRTFKGLVVRADGKPPRRISVQLYDLDDPPDSFPVNEVNAEPDGRFEIHGFADRRYWLHAYEVFYSDPMQSELVTVPADGDTPSIKLVLSKPGYKADLKKPKDN